MSEGAGQSRSRGAIAISLLLVVGVLAFVATFVPWRGSQSLDASGGAVFADHRNADGSWTYTNALAGETSPYLLLHAHNPVDWYPWGPQALQRARAEDKPIFLSVGYSTCYWCHVMEREVFSNPEIAALMNQWFVNIKVDREERPDLDGIYMAATQLLTGGGGWPNSVFMTPELKPFYAGTYFPPEGKYGRPGFPQVLTGLHQAWEQQREQVDQQAEQLTQVIKQSQEARTAAGDAALLSQSLVDGAIHRLQGRFDETNGGFGDAPKFPPDMDLELLMVQYERTKDPELLHLVTYTLEQMARGGIHDHLGGGFHRYATDARWRIPHFEKMLYNQAPLARAYLHAYQLTGAEELRDAARDIFVFTERVLRMPDSGFYSALDSETHGVEGLYYLWTKAQIEETLGADAGLFFVLYDLAPMPEGDRGVIYIPRSLAEVAAERDMESQQLDAQLAPLRQRLLRVRQQRPRPLLDTKILSAWNGMMIDAYAYAYQILGDEAYLTTARQGAAFVWQRLRNEEGRLQRSFRDGTVSHNAFQEDYAFLARGLLALYGATQEQRYLHQAEQLVADMDRLFWDAERGGYFTTDRSEQLIAQSKHPYDGAIPSGNSEAANVLLTLASITGKAAYSTRASETLKAFAGAMDRSAGGFSRMLLAAHHNLNGYDESSPSRSQPPRLAGILAGLTSSQTGAVTLPDSRDHVQIEAFVSVDTLLPGSDFVVAARLLVAPGWHINAHPASYDFLIPTTLKTISELPLARLSIDYPPAGVFKPGFADDSLSVYTDSVVIRATLRLDADAEPGSVEALSVSLQFQACNDAQCLAPAQVSLPVQPGMPPTDP